ncbi:YbjN domain-containing protein [Aestuariispira ectoiniformans]|uniref:YbjN domain-containing protein n=1 Tax=Aestuariispira ectoiniformans TaxID=2775080 RepID=UPI00223B541E|nr:YbjN domain-containing protein [Aestuariispira ectoiniformans]
MSLVQFESTISQPNPLDILEAMFHANEWPFERSETDEMVVETTGGWCDYRMFFAWREDLQALYYTCAFEMRIPEEKRAGLADLLVYINEKMWMGHFDLCSDDGTPIYRQTIPTRGLQSVSVEMLEDMMDIALAECERFYPAFQFLLWGGHSPEEAVAAALLDCVGEA